MTFNEDTRVKIPAILTLTRLGYEYISLKDRNDIDQKTNIFKDIFFKNIRKLNPQTKEVDIKLIDWEHIENNRLSETYDMNVFTEPKLKGCFENAIPTPNKHIYNHAIADSNAKTERNMANSLEIADEVAVYAKLPREFYISTPVGKYNPDWAIAFNKGMVKHIYFVAETKGNMASLELELRGVEKSKIACARKHFAVISSESVKYEVVETYDDLMKAVGG